MGILALMVVVTLVGALIPTQSGINATLARCLGHPLAAAVVNFTVGGVVLLGVAALARTPWPSSSAAASAPPWAWAGGLCGAALVVTGVLAAPRLGAALLVACLVSGQMAASVVVDHFGWVGFAERPVTWVRAFGVLVLGLGVLLVRKG